MIDVAIIVGSTRPGRKAPSVARWVNAIADKRDDAVFEVVDTADYALSMFSDFADGEARPDPRHEDVLTTMLDEVVSWGEALTSLRAPAPQPQTASRTAERHIAQLSLA